MNMNTTYPSGIVGGPVGVGKIVFRTANSLYWPSLKAGGKGARFRSGGRVIRHRDKTGF